MKWLRLMLWFCGGAVLFCHAQCNKQHRPLNITLHDKPLRVIQSYTQGTWKFQYAYGGISPMKYPSKDNAYMILQPNRIIIGNDSAGVIIDTVIVWKRARDIFNDSTYLLTYSYSRGYAFPGSYIVDRILNDTLELIDDAYDPLYYYYTKR